VEALTFLAKTDADQVRLEMQPVELGELIRESFEDAIVLAEPHNVQVSLLTCDDLTIRGDRHRLRQVLLNLVDNAVKYNRHGGTVTMSLQRMNDSAVIEIVNTGKGVSAEAQEQVFDRFMRGDNAVMSAIDGSGLGLTIARWIVQSHCGAIQFISVPDQQTTVRVCLPLDNVVSAV
jgi:signal transduction histidine kinase